MAAGSHSVRLIGLPRHCSTPANPYVAQVAEDQITPLVFEISCDRAAPDRVRVAFSTIVASGKEPEIFGVDGDGLGMVSLTNHPQKDLHPVWSPDGRWVAFLSDRASPGILALHVMASDGTGVRRLAESVATYAWSPEGTRLAYVADGNPRVSLVGVDGANRKSVLEATDTLRASGFGLDWLDWSPDGTRLALMLARAEPDTGRTLGLATVAVEDGAVAFVDRLGMLFGSPVPPGPRWSPDGAHLLYSLTKVLRCDWGSCFREDSLMVASFDGELPFAVGVSGQHVVWSLDGSHIISDSTLIAADGSARSALGVLPIGDPIWSRDGTEMEFYCAIPSAQVGGVCRAAPDGSGARLAVDWEFIRVEEMALRPWGHDAAREEK